MKTNLIIILFALFILQQSKAFAQLKSFKQEDIDLLKKEKFINLEFSFDSMEIVDPAMRYKTEEEYIRHKVKEHNEAHPGKGDKWMAEWNENKTTLFEPVFKELMDKRLRKYDVETVQNQMLAVYTVLIKTKMIDIGWPGAGRVFEPAKLNIEMIVFPIGDSSNVVARYYFNAINGRGGGGDYSSTSGERIKGAYSTAGSLIGSLLVSKVYK